MHRSGQTVQRLSGSWRHSLIDTRDDAGGAGGLPTGDHNAAHHHQGPHGHSSRGQRQTGPQSAVNPTASGVVHPQPQPSPQQCPQGLTQEPTTQHQSCYECDAPPAQAPVRRSRRQ